MHESFTNQDAAAVLKKSGNLNAALKNFLKREIKPGDPAARFVKDFRDVSDGADATRIESYIERNRAKFENYILAIGRYAHSEVSTGIIHAVVEKHADAFNKTYQSKGDAIEVTDKKQFDAIVAQALKQIDGEIAKAGFPESKFFRTMVMQAIFDKPVLDKIVASN